MHLFLRAIGFSEATDEQIEKLIEAAINKMQNNSAMVYASDFFDRASIVIPTSESTALCVYGRFDGREFIKEYYYPVLLGGSESENEEITIERHMDKESYEVICEDIKVGVTLIFYLQNPIDYLDFVKARSPQFDISRKNLAEKEGIYGKKVVLSAMSVGGMILLPTMSGSEKERKKNPRQAAKEAAYNELVIAARNGDQDAIENLTIQDLDTYTSISRRVVHEDVLSIVESSFMPCGVECDQYSVVGEILEIEHQVNAFTKDEICLMKLSCNDLVFDLVINEADLMGEPALGRRFKGNIWLQGEVQF